MGITSPSPLIISTITINFDCVEIYVDILIIKFIRHVQRKLRINNKLGPFVLYWGSNAYVY